MCRIETMIEEIRSCESIGRLEHMHDTCINNYNGLEKIDFEIEYVKKYQDLTRRKKN